MSQNDYGLPSHLTDQAIFDKVALHLIRQEGKSLHDTATSFPSCAYRGDGGRACAVGVLIADDQYSIEMEGRLAYGLCADFLPDLMPFENLLSDLQNVHDNQPSEAFDLPALIRALRRTASRFGLSDAALNAPKAIELTPPTLPDEITRLLGAGKVEA